MNHKIKAVGLTLFAALALSAVTAAPASAVTHLFKGGSNPTHLTAEAEGPQIFEFTTGTHNGFTCEAVNFNAATIKAGEAEFITAEPDHTECHIFRTNEAETETEEIGSAIVKDEGCHYTFTGDTETGNPTGGEHATIHLTHTPEQCEHLEIKATAFQFKCLSIPTTVEEIPQTLNGVRYNKTTDPATEKEAVTVEATVHGIVSTTTESIASCGEGTHTNGSYTGNITVKGFSDEAHTEPTDVTFNSQ